MKKVFLLVSIAGLVSVTSCKKENKDQVNDTVEQKAEVEQQAQGAEEQVNKTEEENVVVPAAPQLEDTELQEWVNKLHDEAVKAKSAINTDNQADLKAAITEITSLVEVLNTLKDKADYQKAQDYYNQVQEELQ